MDTGEGVPPAPRRIGRQLLFNNYRYRKQNTLKKGSSLEAIYWKCTKDRCKARVVEYPVTGTFKETKGWEHSCNYDEAERTKDIALERLRELTLAAKNGDKATEIIRKFLEELPPETISLLPHDRALGERVRKLAKSTGLVLGRSSFEDFYLEEGDEGAGLGDVPVDRILTAGDGREDRLGLLDGVSLPSAESVCAISINPDDNRDDNNSVDAIFEGGDHSIEFPEDLDNYEPEMKHVHSQSTCIGKGSPKSRTTSTSSKGSRISTKRPGRSGVKSGQKCFVCGDELLVSETVSSRSSQEIFRKACTYLNVKYQTEWFPKKSNGQFYSFCESCTDEIIKIHELYQNVEEMQSVIFKRVEQVEKRLTEAEIMDNWLADASVSSAKRFEGFRQQVLINYKNKLKLRREIRLGKKMGQPLTEIQPITSAHMFASDPAGTSRTATATKSTSHGALLPKRSCGRPKSRKKTEEPVAVERKPIVSDLDHHSSLEELEEANTFAFLNNDFDNASDNADNDFDGGGETEKKFWVDDPTRLNVQPEKNAEDEGNQDESSSDSEGESTQDEDWIKSKSTRRKRPTRKRKMPLSNSFAPTSEVQKGATGTGKGKTISKDVPDAKLKPCSQQPKLAKPLRKSHSRNIDFPDIVLSQDGRMFMSGIEIIKNAPGHYPRRPRMISFTCGACEKITTCFHRMKSHICGHHLRLYKCHVCGRQISDARNLQNHIQAKHSRTTTRTPCPICAKPISGEERHLRYHIWSHLSEEERKDPQYQSYARPSKRDPKYKNPNSRLQTFICSFCPKSFYRVGALRTHESTVHSGDANENFQCQYCGKFYKSKGSLRCHSKTCMKTADGIGFESLRKFPCVHCPVILKSQRIRVLHMHRFHPNPGSQPFACPKCPRRFSSRGGFKQHKRVCVEGLSNAASSRKGRGGRRANQNQNDNQLPKDEHNMEGNQFPPNPEPLHPNPYLNISGGSGRGSTNDIGSGSSSFSSNLFGNYPGSRVGDNFQPRQHQ